MLPLRESLCNTRIESMPRRRTRGPDVKIRTPSADAIEPAPANEPADTFAEEQRQIRAARTEYFSILQEWSRTRELVSDAEHRE